MKQKLKDELDDLDKNNPTSEYLCFRVWLGNKVFTQELVLASSAISTIRYVQVEGNTYYNSIWFKVLKNGQDTPAQ